MRKRLVKKIGKKLLKDFDILWREGKTIVHGNPRPENWIEKTISKSPLNIGVDLADGPDRTAYFCPVCRNEIRGNDKVCCGVWHE